MSRSTETKRLLSKLPKWAQHKIELLERDKLHWFEKYRDINNELHDGGSAVFISDFTNKIPVQDFFQYGFYISEDRSHYVKAKPDPVKGHLELRLPTSGSLLIQPVAANVVHIRRRDW